MNWLSFQIGIEIVLMIYSVILPTLRIGYYAFDATLHELVSSRLSARYDLLMMS